MKRYIYPSLLYAILAMIGGVFYRGMTRRNGFTGITALSYVHVHYFMLGTMFFLLLLLLEKNFSFQNGKTRGILIAYHIGLNITVILFVVRGITQVLNSSLSSAVDASISGFAGIGHIILGISIILILLQIKRGVMNTSKD